MPSEFIKEEKLDVPTQVFEQFLCALEASGDLLEMTAGLRKALLEDKTFSESTLKKVVLSEEPTK